MLQQEHFLDHWCMLYFLSYSSYHLCTTNTYSQTYFSRFFIESSLTGLNLNFAQRDVNGSMILNSGKNKHIEMEYLLT